MVRILSIDPSGTGTTGIYFRNGQQEEFNCYQGKDWQKHYEFIVSLVKVYQPDILLYESTNYVGLRGKDMTSLFKLLGALAVLPVEIIKSVPVNQVKELKGKLLKGTKTISGLEYHQGRGKELEIKRIARLFAEKQQIKVEVFFHRPAGEKFNEEWLRHNGFHDGKTVPGLHQIYLKLTRDESLIFRTLAHELAHTLQQEVEGKQYSKKHNLTFWKTLDDYTLPFVLENLPKEDREGLLSLANPTTNQAEENDRVYLETQEGIIKFPVEPENVNEHDKQNKGEIARVIEKLAELGVSEEKDRQNFQQDIRAFHSNNHQRRILCLGKKTLTRQPRMLQASFLRCPKARGGRAKTVSEIVYEEAIPIDQEFLPREQFNFRDLVDSLKRKDQPLKITFLANPYSWSSWFLTLEETLNPFTRNWDDFMITRPKKYQILYAVQDYFFCEVGERKVHKKYALMHFTRNKKETEKSLVNFCFGLEEKAKSKLKNCRIRDKGKVVGK
ncbi:2910_t:CDS:2 [Entrophospora sp. SA101]|nr:2910_t:CDS:2 [Entrophospora sp. SA101]